MPVPELRADAPALSASPAAAALLCGVAVGLCFLLGIGLYDRAAALGLWYVGTCVLTTNPLIGWLLLAHVFLPTAPYGSWAARGRVDPGGGWRMPPVFFAAAWGVLALTQAWRGLDHVLSPAWRDGRALAELFDAPALRSAWAGVATWTMLVVELVFAPLALVPRLRPWLWTLMLLIHLTLLVAGGLASGSVGLVLLHLFTWNPGWIRPLSRATERIFYDGHCGLCQRSVRLILAEDATETAFRFAPLQGETFAALLSAAERASLPMSLVVRTESGTLLTRSAGVLHILRRLGGTWRLLAGVLVLLPPVVRDALYDGVARIRHRLFAQPKDVCPLMPPRLRVRFDP